MTLLEDVNGPESQEVLVSNWEPACSLVEDASLGPRLSLSSSGCPLPASLSPAEDGPVCSWLALLWYLLSPLFCERAWQCLTLEFFVGKFSLSLFFPLSLAILQFGLLSHVSSLRLSSEHSGPICPCPKQCCPCLPVQPPLAGGERYRLGYLSPGSCA